MSDAAFGAPVLVDDLLSGLSAAAGRCLLRGGRLDRRRWRRQCGSDGRVGAVEQGVGGFVAAAARERRLEQLSCAGVA